MPVKRLAVRGGLCEYGRNNITYCGDWGSFVRLGAYVSDMEPKDYIWRDVVSMASCENCCKCAANCPTKAISPNRFLINCEICLSNLNGADGQDIPDWVPASVHNGLYGCYRCQEICPANKDCFENIDQIVFDEAETKIMLNSSSYADFPESIRKKLWHYEVPGAEFACIPRNLALMISK